MKKIKELIFNVKCLLFVKKLNKIHQMNIRCEFKQSDSLFTYNGQKNIINCNFINFELHKKNNHEYNVLGKNFYKYAILHEFGHSFYSKELTDFISYHKNSKKYNSELESYCYMKRGLLSYNSFLFLSLWEYLADFFIFKQNNKIFKGFNKYTYLLWRISFFKKAFYEFQDFPINDEIMEYYLYYNIPKLILKSPTVSDLELALNESLTLISVLSSIESNKNTKEKSFLINELKEMEIILNKHILK